MRVAIALALCAGCASLIGIDDSRALTCHELSVIDDTGASVPISPAFASDHADYTAQVAPAVTSVRVAIACDDPDATIAVNGGDAMQSLAVPAVAHITVRAATADPEPELDYTVSVGVGP